MNSFYLTLPSNSSMSYYPENTLTHFITRLPTRIDLNGSWEVGLVEIQYPHTWYNVHTEEGEMTLITWGDDSVLHETVFHVPGGYYPTVESLLRRIEEETRIALNRTGSNPVSFVYDEITRKIQVNLDNCILVIGARVQGILGTVLESLPVGRTLGDQVVDMDPLHSLYVYCDLLESRIVGDSMAPLLRVVPVEGKDTDMVTRIYENVHYVPLQRKSFQTIEMDIRDSMGKNVPFECGTLNVTLHLRRRRHLI